MQKYHTHVPSPAAHVWLCPACSSLWQHITVLVEGCARHGACRLPLQGQCSLPSFCHTTGRFITCIIIIQACCCASPQAQPQAAEWKGKGRFPVIVKGSYTVRLLLAEYPLSSFTSKHRVTMLTTA